jgi:hypothetical protein
MRFDLGHVRSFPAEPRETNALGSRPLSSRGDRCLANLALPARGAGTLTRARRQELTCLMDRPSHPPLSTDAPFALTPSVGELLRSSCYPQNSRRWGRPLYRRVASPLRSAYRTGVPWSDQRRRRTVTGQCDQPLCPGETTPYPDEPRPLTVPCGVGREYSGRPVRPQCFDRPRSVAPHRGPNRWPLPNCPGPAPSSATITGRRWLHALRQRDQDFRTGYGPARVGLNQIGVRSGRTVC